MKPFNNQISAHLELQHPYRVDSGSHPIIESKATSSAGRT